MKKSGFIYLLAMMTIIGWWYLAFAPAPSLPSDSPACLPVNKAACSLLNHLSPLDRKMLKQALSGDFVLMSKLIADWDVDAQILASHGLPMIQRLTPKTFLKSQILGRKLRLRTRSKLKFLPQTYASASFLLAIADPEQIIALPRGLRKQTHIYPESITAKIPLDIDRCNSEKLFLAKPDIAFVSSHYSHPACIQALRRQGIKIHDTKSLCSLENIQNALQSIGRVIHRKKEAALLSIFIEASLQAIENRLLAQKQENPSLLAAKILYLNFHETFYLPSRETFACELLEKLEITHYPFRRSSVPLERENLFTLNPDCLIISSIHGEALKKQIESDPALQNLTAVKEKKVFIVDDAVQQSPTQYAVLAYFDLAQVLAQVDAP